MKKTALFILLISIFNFGQTKDAFEITRLKYNGGSDWYNGQTEEVNLLNYIAANTNVKVNPQYSFVDISSDDIFSNPFLFMTGHGNINFSDDEAQRLRKFLENGGFLYVDDDYGLNPAFRREIEKVFPEKELKELPFSYGLYNVFYQFPNGVPKIHEHDGKPAQGFGIFIDKRLAVFYTYESNPSDGWDDRQVHNDPEEKRIEALKFGTNIVLWALTQ